MRREERRGKPDLYVDHAGNLCYGQRIESITQPPKYVMPRMLRLVCILQGGVLLAVVLPSFGCRALPGRDAFETGMGREQVVARFGEPFERDTLRKTEEPIWGAIEGFWDTVPLGSTVEICWYQARGGTVELYFLDGSAQVSGIGFAPEGVVF